MFRSLELRPALDGSIKGDLAVKHSYSNGLSLEFCVAPKRFFDPPLEVGRGAMAIRLEIPTTPARSRTAVAAALFWYCHPTLPFERYPAVLHPGGDRIPWYGCAPCKRADGALRDLVVRGDMRAIWVFQRR